MATKSVPVTVKIAMAILVFSTAYVTCGSCAAVVPVSTSVTTHETPTSPGSEHPISGTSCTPSDRDLTPQEMSQLFRDFADASSITSEVFQVANTQQYTHEDASVCYFSVKTPFHPPQQLTSASQASEDLILISLIEFYHNLTRVANYTSLTLMVEEQKALKLDNSSFYQRIWTLKDKVYSGTKLLISLLRSKGYCAIDSPPYIPYEIPSGCDKRYVRLVREMADIHNTTKFVAQLIAKLQE